MSKKRFLLFPGLAAVVLVAVFFHGRSRDSDQRPLSLSRTDLYLQFYKEQKQFRRFTSEKKFQRDVETTPEEVKHILLKSKETVRISATKRVKGNTVFVGRITAKGQKETNQCVSEGFAVAVGGSPFTVKDEKTVFNIQKGFISRSQIGNVMFIYLEVECEGYTDYSGGLLNEAILNLENEIRGLMSDIPKGP